MITSNNARGDVRLISFRQTDVRSVPLTNIESTKMEILGKLQAKKPTNEGNGDVERNMYSASLVQSNERLFGWWTWIEIHCDLLTQFCYC